MLDEVGATAYFEQAVAIKQADGVDILKHKLAPGLLKRGKRGPQGSCRDLQQENIDIPEPACEALVLLNLRQNTLDLQAGADQRVIADRVQCQSVPIVGSPSLLRPEACGLAPPGRCSSRPTWRRA